MAVPKKKKSRARSGNQASHDALKKLVISYDSNGNPHLPHRATKMQDGGHFYKNSIVLQGKKKSEEAKS